MPWSRLECPGAAWSALPPAAAAVATTATAAVWVSGVSGGGAGVPGGALELRKLRVVGLEVAPWPGPRECVVCRKPRDELSPPQVSSPKKRQNNRFVWFRGGGRRRSREAVVHVVEVLFRPPVYRGNLMDSRISSRGPPRAAVGSLRQRPGNVVNGLHYVAYAFVALCLRWWPAARA